MVPLLIKSITVLKKVRGYIYVVVIYAVALGSQVIHLRM